MHPNDSLLNDHVDEHLGDCGRCRTLVAELRDLRHAAANLPQVAPSPRVWSRIERELRESSIASHPSTVTSRQSKMSRRRLHLLDWRLVLAPVAAVLLLTAWVGYRLAERQAVPQPTASLATPSAQSVEAEL